MAIDADTDIRPLGAGLARPECVLTHVSEYLIASDWTGNGGVAVIAPDGHVGRVLARTEAADGPLRPNGICLEPGGTILAAHLGPDTGGVYRLHPDGRLEPVLTEIDGAPLPPSNFPLRDVEGRLWLTVSTRVTPRTDDYRPTAATGFIALKDQDGTRIVADDLGYTNECAFSADGRHLYVNETFARRVARFTVGADGSLSERTVVATFGAGTYPDGLAIDRDGGLWITSVVSNRVLRVDPGGGVETVIEDADAAHVASVEAAFVAGRMGREHLAKAAGRRLRNVSSLAFGGPDLRTACLGSLHDDRVQVFRSPVPGLEPIHYRYDITALRRHAGLV